MAGHESIATSLLVLKAFAKNPDADYAEIAELTGKPENIVAEIVKEYVSVYLSQEAEHDFPASLIAQYKDKSGNDLSMEDFEGLTPLVDDFRQGREEEADDGKRKRTTITACRRPVCHQKYLVMPPIPYNTTNMMTEVAE